MKHRGLFYFFIVSVFFYSLFFAKIFSFYPDSASQSLAKKLLQTFEDKKASPQLVETFIQLEHEKKTPNLSSLQSKDQGKQTKKEGYSYYNPIRYLAVNEFVNPNQKSLNQNTKNLLKPKKQDPWGDISVSENQKKQDLSHVQKQQTPVPFDVLPNKYVQEEIRINLSSDGFVGIDAQKSDFAQYLIEVAKKVFFNWVDFIPAMQIDQNLIKTNPSGMIESTLIIYFDEEHKKYSFDFLAPFSSQTMNNLTQRSFLYLTLPQAPQKIQINTLIMRLSVHPITKRATGEFKFDYLKEKKEWEE